MIYFIFIADEKGSSYVYDRRLGYFKEKPEDVSIADLYGEKFRDCVIMFKPVLDEIKIQARKQSLNAESIELYELTGKSVKP